MVEIYWLQRLGNIGFCFNVGFWVCIIIACAVLVVVVRVLAAHFEWNLPNIKYDEE